MSTLAQASTQLKTRPADQHFASFGDLTRAAQTDAKNSRTADVPVGGLQVFAQGDALLIGRAGADEARRYPMTYGGARSILRLAGASPEFVLGRLSTETAAAAITEGLARSPEANDSVQLLIGTETNAFGVTSGPRLRAVTSPSYCRVWDADMLREVHEWALPLGYAPALPTKNTDAQRNNVQGNNKPALFRGGDSSFAFLMTEKSTDFGDGSSPMRGGLMIRNSETGKASLGVMRMVFSEFCANFLIWDATVQGSQRIIHRGRSDADLLRRFRRELQALKPELQQNELDVIAAAGKAQFASDTEVAAERLVKQFGLSQERAGLALERATWAENRGTRKLSHLWVANGVTSLAKETTYADALTELATIGGDIVLAGAV